MKSSRLQMFYKQNILKKFTIFTSEHFFGSLYLVWDFSLYLIWDIKMRLWHRCLFASFAKHSRTSILKNTSGQRHKRCVKSVHIRSFFGQYFPSFGLNTVICIVDLRIQSECGKTRTSKKLQIVTLFTPWSYFSPNSHKNVLP